MATTPDPTPCPRCERPRPACECLPPGERQVQILPLYGPGVFDADDPATCIEGYEVLVPVTAGNGNRGCALQFNGSTFATVAEARRFALFLGGDAAFSGITFASAWRVLGRGPGPV